MKKGLLTLLVVVLVVAGLGTAAFAGYRYGYTQGAVASSDGKAPQVGPGFGYGPQRRPMHGFGFDRDFGRVPNRGFGMMQGRGIMGFGFFGPLLGLVRIAFWALVIWAVYMLVTRSGWRLTRTTQTVEAQPTATETNAKE